MNKNIIRKALARPFNLQPKNSNALVYDTVISLRTLNTLRQQSLKWDRLGFWLVLWICTHQIFDQSNTRWGPFTFGIAPKVTKGLGPKPPKAGNPGGIPKIRKLATLRQYGFLNGIPPGFSPAERFFRQRPGVTRVTGRNSTATCSGFRIWHPVFYTTSMTLKNLYFLMSTVFCKFW